MQSEPVDLNCVVNGCGSDEFALSAVMPSATDIDTSMRRYHRANQPVVGVS